MLKLFENNVRLPKLSNCHKCAITRGQEQIGFIVQINLCANLCSRT